MMRVFGSIINRLSTSRQVPISVRTLYQAVENYLPPNPTILEAGAHMGYDTIGLSLIWPKGLIYAFEPIPELFEQLNSRVRRRSNVKIHNIALGEKCTTVTMFVSSGQSTASSSILEPTLHTEIFPEVCFENTIQVVMKTIDVWASEESVKKIDLMWLDMQGYEVNAITGAASLIENVSVIYTELCKDELYLGMKIQDEYISFLDSLGFQQISTNDQARVSEGIFINRKKFKV